MLRLLDEGKSKVRQLEDELVAKNRALAYLESDSRAERDRLQGQLEALRARLNETVGGHEADIRRLHEHYKNEKSQMLDLQQEQIYYFVVELARAEETISELREAGGRLENESSELRKALGGTRASLAQS